MNNKILVIVDMQNDFITGALQNDAAKEIVPKIVKFLATTDFNKIICTLDTHDADYLNTIEGKYLPVPHCIKGTDGWMLNDAIQQKLIGKNVQFLEKNTFGCKNLPQFIDDSCDEVVMIGTCTGICVINNAALIKAFHPNKQITVYENLCACVNPHTHDMAIEQMAFNHINIDTWKEI